MILHLLFNCFPASHSDEWKRAAEEVLEHESKFRGRKIVIIKTGEGLEDPSSVFSFFGRESEFLLFPNDPKLGEVVGFIEALELLKEERGVTFYAHTKGARYKDSDRVFMDKIRAWRKEMLEGCLGDLRKTELALSNYSCAGSYRRFFGEYAQHYDGAAFAFWGNYWLVRNDALFSRAWKSVPRKNYQGVEHYLGRLFKVDESYCFDHDDVKFSPYDVKVTFGCVKCGTEHEGYASSFTAISICPRCQVYSSHVVSS